MMKIVVLLWLLPITQGDEVCHGMYGCFSNDPPFDNAGGSLPQTPSELNVTFLLFTRSNPEVEQLLVEGNDQSVIDSYYNPNIPTKFILHGFLGAGTVAWVRNLTKELLLHDDVNAIAVNWKDGASGPLYSQAAANTRLVGAIVARMMTTLNSMGALYSEMHLIGHSLGAQTSGYAGTLTPGLGRITGMDPAGPSFEFTDPRVRLDPTDADFVDVIHSDGANTGNPGLGLLQPIGHADFYPNGGINQKGCPDDVGGSVLFGIISGSLPVSQVTCSHSRSHQFFTSSINRCNYKAYPCPDVTNSTGACVPRECSEMGYHASPLNVGNYFLETTDQGPDFCCKD